MDQAELVLIINTFRSKYLPVMRHIVGKADQSKLDPTLSQAASYRATKWEVSQASAVAGAINRVVMPKVKDVKCVKVEDVRLAAHSVGNQFAFDFVSCNWGAINFPKVLVWDMQQQLGMSKEKQVAKERWYIEGGSRMFDDLKEPLAQLMTNFLP